MSETIIKMLSDLLPVVGTLLTAILGWVSIQAERYIRAKISNSYAQNALIRLNETAEIVVKELSQTYVDGLKEKTADGKLTEEEKRQLKEMAVTKMKSYLGVEGLKLLKYIMGGDDIAGLLSGAIERKVCESKLGSLLKRSKKEPK